MWKDKEEKRWGMENIKEKLTHKNREEYKLARNEYVSVRREEERSYEKGIS